MSAQIAGKDGASLLDVDSMFNAARISMRPPKVIEWSSIAGNTGVLTGAAAGALLFSLRNTGPNAIMVRRAWLAYQQIAAFTAAQRMEFALLVSRAITVAPTGGTTISPASGKHRTAMPTPSIEALIAGTTGLTAGAATVDPAPIGMAPAWIGAAGATFASTPLFSHDAGDYPLMLSSGEGIRVINQQAMGAGGTGIAYVTVEFAEISPADYGG